MEVEFWERKSAAEEGEMLLKQLREVERGQERCRVFCQSFKRELER